MSDLKTPGHPAILLSESLEAAVYVLLERVRRAGFQSIKEAADEVERLLKESIDAAPSPLTPEVVRLLGDLLERLRRMHGGGGDWESPLALEIGLRIDELRRLSASEPAPVPAGLRLRWDGPDLKLGSVTVGTIRKYDRQPWSACGPRDMVVTSIECGDSEAEARAAVESRARAMLSAPEVRAEDVEEISRFLKHEEMRGYGPRDQATMKGLFKRMHTLLAALDGKPSPNTTETP